MAMGPTVRTHITDWCVDVTILTVYVIRPGSITSVALMATPTKATVTCPLRVVKSRRRLPSVT